MDTEPQAVIEWFKDFHQPDFVRSGNCASHTAVLPTDPVMQHHSDLPELSSHNEELQLCLTTVMRKGVLMLKNPHRLCRYPFLARRRNFRRAVRAPFLLPRVPMSQHPTPHVRN
jgi:hypothetical protein